MSSYLTINKTFEANGANIFFTHLEIFRFSDYTHCQNFASFFQSFKHKSKNCTHKMQNDYVCGSGMCVSFQKLCDK